MLSGLEPIAEKIQEQQASSPVHRWQEIPLDDQLSSHAKKAALRLNALGSLFYFSHIVLNHDRLKELHRYMCRQLERDSLRVVMEWPRDHFKTTVASVSAPMWWGLPFTNEDEDLMCSMGYGPEWTRWMKRAHYTSTRTLIASEVIGNARKIGSKIDGHYQSNAIFRYLFPSILPKGTERWNQDSMCHNRMDGVYHGEGTFDFIGVKGALQSRHYDRIVEDDLVGEKAINSDLVMEATIEWHRKLPGAFDSDPLRPGQLNDQLVIGNRWSNRDLNYWIGKNETSYEFETHSAEGGCCKVHPDPGKPIFPEEFTMEKLNSIRQTEGTYNYSCQFRNKPVDPEAVRFKSSWLRHYSVDVWNQDSLPKQNIANWQQLSHSMRSQDHAGDLAESQGATPQRLKMAIKHECEAGEVLDDVRAGELDRVCILDPNHAQQQGRSRHAVVVLGVLNRANQPRRIYLLDVWAKASSFEEMIEACIGVKPGHRGLAVKWRCHYLYLESEVAGQQGWKFYFKERVSRMGMDGMFTVRPLKTDRSANGKEKRILGMEPIYENGLFWVRRTGQSDFMTEYEEYPNGSTCDILDVIGYCPQTWGIGSRAQARDFLLEEMRRREKLVQGVGSAGY